MIDINEDLSDFVIINWFYKMIKIISLIDSECRNKDYGLNFSFFDAVDNTKVISKFTFDESIARLIYGRIIRNGEIGCTLSHYECICNFASHSKENWLCILEDDALIEKGFNEQLLKISKELILKPTIFVLGHSKIKKENNWIRLLKFPSYHDFQIANMLFLQTNENFCGTIAYMINQPAANIIKSQEKIFWIADDWRIIENMGIDIFHAKYPIVYEDLATTSFTGNEIRCVHSYFFQNIYTLIKNRVKYLFNK